MSARHLVAAVALLLTTSGRPAPAEPQLQVADLVPITLRDDPQARLSLLVHGTSSGGSAAVGLSDLRAVVRELKDPDGQSLVPSLLDVQVESPQLGEQGAHIYLRPDLAGFRRPGDYLAILYLGATAAPPSTAAATPQRPIAAPTVSRLVTLTLRREKPSLYGEPLSLKLLRPAPWRAARLQVGYAVENRGQRPVHDLSIDTQPLSVAAPSAEIASELAPGNLTVVLPPPPPGEALQRQRTAKSLEIAPGGRVSLTLILGELSTVGRFRSGLSLHAPDLRTPELLPITIEVIDRWEFGLLAITVGVLLSALLHKLGGRYRPAAENRYRLAHLAFEVEDLHPTGLASLTARAGFAEKLRRAEKANADGEVTLCHRLLDEIEAALETFYGTQSELRAIVRELLEQAQQKGHLLGSHLPALNLEQAARLRQLRFEVERSAALLGSEQLEAAQAALRSTLEQLQELGQTLTAPDPDGPTLHAAGLPPLVAKPVLRIEVQQAAARWQVGSAVRLRVLDERAPGARSEGEVYVWRFGGSPAEPGAPEVEYPLDKPGDLDVQVTVRRADGAELITARRWLTVRPPRPALDLDAAPAPKLRAQRVLTLLSLLLAGLSGVYFLCFSTALVPFLGKSFGTPMHYVVGVAWGLVADLLLRGFADLLVRLSAES